MSIDRVSSVRDGHHQCRSPDVRRGSGFGGDHRLGVECPQKDRGPDATTG